MRYVKTIIGFLFSFHSILYSQDLNPRQHGMALYELTSIADYFIETNATVGLNKSDTSLKWIVGDDRFIYTKSIPNEAGFAYKTLYSNENKFIVGVYLSSMGSGEFSYVLKIQLLGDSMSLNEVIMGGDRCQKGINFNVTYVKNEILYYSHFITPMRLMNWFTKSKKQNYGDCMICCCGYAQFEYNILTSKKEFQNIVLVKDALTEDASILKIYNQFPNANKDGTTLILPENELREFIKSIEK